MIPSRRYLIPFALITFLAASTPADASHSAGQSDAIQSSRCVALPLPTLRGADGPASQLAGGLRELVGDFLKGPSLHAIPLEARLPDQVLEEARAQGCPTVLSVVLIRKKPGSGGLGRVLGDAAGAAAWHMPYGASATSNAIRGAAIAGAAATSTIASTTRAKDEMQIEYRLLSGDGAVLREGKDQARASADGEDLVTPLVERMATAVVSALPR